MSVVSLQKRNNGICFFRVDNNSHLNDDERRPLDDTVKQTRTIHIE